MFSIFKNYLNLLMELSERSDGNMKLSTKDNDERVLSNRRRYFSKIGANGDDVISAEIIHGEGVYSASEKDKGKIIPVVDALITNEKNVFLSVTVADCLPIFLFDTENCAVGIIHAGWRGLASIQRDASSSRSGLKKGIISQTIEKLKKEFKSNPKKILAGIGSGICVKHYEIGEETAAYFQKYVGLAIIDKSGKKYLDIKKIAEIKLKEEGILKNNIEIHPDCTYESVEKYFSYRRDKPDEIQAMVAVIGICCHSREGGNPVK